MSGVYYVYQKLQDGKKVLCVSQNSPHSENRPVQTASNVFLNYPKTPKSEIQKVSEKHLKSRKFEKIRPLLL